MAENADRKIIIKKEISIPADFAEPYMYIYFSVPKQTNKVGVTFSHERKNSFPWIYVSLFDPIDYRGSQLKYIKEGIAEYDLWVSQNDSSRGCIPGEIPEGKWHVQLDITQLKNDEKGLINIYYEAGEPAGQVPTPYFDDRIVNSSPGWYRGELHSHTTESDGKLHVNELIKMADSAELDFLAITDHFTISQWWRVDETTLPEIVLLNSSEITSQNGHANIHGINKWVDVFIDRDEWNVNQAAEQTHQQGGLFCINHLMSSLLAWRHFDFDWKNADLMEVYHSLEGANNIPQIGMWDALLREKHRIIGVAGTDCHYPENEIETLGKVTTWVHAKELSQKGILEGLKKGNVFISFGPKIEFSIQNANGSKAQMGGSIKSNDEPLNLSISIESDKPTRVTIIKNGFFLDSIDVVPEKGIPQVVEFVDNKPLPGYYRFELHDIKNNPTYRGIEWRDFSTIQALSNPIWVE